MKLTALTQPDVIALIVGIIGVVLAVVFYYRSKISVRPCFAIQSAEIIGTAHHMPSGVNSSVQFLPDAVEVRYHGESIPSLYKASIAFWNAGRKTLDHSDVASADPIEIHFDGETIKLLEIRSKTSTREVVGANFRINKSTVSVTFDFLDQNDGGACEVFYTGLATKIRVVGTIKGAVDGIQYRPFGPITFSSIFPHGRVPKFNLRSLALPTYGAIWGILYAGFGIAILISSLDHSHHGKSDWVQVVLGISAAAVGLACAGLCFALRYYQMLMRLWDKIAGRTNPPDPEMENVQTSKP